MRIERVHIGAFGPFHDRTLELGAGLTVVFGPNEAGKSTWHAALYAALCGLRRGGGLARDDREFAARHRPWNAEGWQVSADLTLEDGRQVEVRQDLDRRVACSARDRILGTELTPEIINDGTPDASRWLGLDRRSFLATACVRQADMLDVLQNAGSLQEHIQRAAATGGADETAARALDILADFEREHVGLDRVNSTKPLRLAMDRTARATQARDLATDSHQEYLVHVERADGLEHEAALREHERLRFEAVLTRDRAASWMRAAARARELWMRHPGPEPAALQEEDEQSRRVAAALSAYRELPLPKALAGPSAAALLADLDALPDHPAGDLEPDPAVRAAYAAWDGAHRSLSLHDERHPLEPAPPTTQVPAARLREIATELEAAAAHGRGGPRLPRRTTMPALAVGGTLAIAGVVTAALGLLIPGALAVFAGAGLAIAVALLAHSANLQELRAADADRRRFAAEALARELSLPADQARLRALASEADTFELGRRSRQEWDAARSRLAESLAHAAATLHEVLAGRGLPTSPDLRLSYGDYEAACATRRSQAIEAARRPGLEEALRQRREREQEADKLDRRRREALSRLREVAESCGVTGANDTDLGPGLDAWLDRRGDELKRRDAEVRERAELRSLLDGGSLEELEGRAEAYRRRAQQMAASFDAAELDAVDLGGDPDARLAELAAAARNARQLADRARGEVETQAKLVPSVAAAEEELSRAEDELREVRELARTISLTRGLLQNAQERVHRSIAPVLKRTVEAWLPGVTCGRYQEVMVTPETLQVQVRATNREWRDADRLSQGTREQIYLLLRLALVEHLTRPDEVCPLILDDVTVQCDAARTVAVLDLLHEISRARQVVLFSQEDDVRSWAEARLDAAGDRLVELDPRAVPA